MVRSKIIPTVNLTIISIALIGNNFYTDPTPNNSRTPRINKEPVQNCGLEEVVEYKKDVLDNIVDDKEHEVEVLDEEITPNNVGNVLGAIISKPEGTNKVKAADFGRKKVKKNKKMETGLLKEILDFKQNGSRRQCS